MAQRLNSRLTCSSGNAFRKLAQFSFRHSELGGATIQTDHKFWKYPRDGLVNVLQSGEMNAYLPNELPLVDRPARLAGHTGPPIPGPPYWNRSSRFLNGHTSTPEQLLRLRVERAPN